MKGNESSTVTSHIPGQASLNSITGKTLALPALATVASPPDTTDSASEKHLTLEKPIIFNINNTGAGTTQEIYGEKTNLFYDVFRLNH